MPPEVAWTAVLAGVGTYVIRSVPLALARRVAGLAPAARRPLRMIPPAALSALVALAVLRPGGELELFGPRALAAVVAGVAGWRTKNLLVTVVVGVAVLGVLD